MFSSFFPASARIASKAIFLDLDDTITKPARHPDGTYIVEEDGYIDAVLLNEEKFAALVQLAIANDIPLYIVTGRPDIERCIQLIHRLIESVNGFHEGIGGFHRNAIYYLGKMVMEDGKLVRKEIDTKVNVLQTAHQQKHPTLARENILFVDDMDVYRDPIDALGYQTIKANPDTLEHFEKIIQFMLHNHEVQNTQHHQITELRVL